MPRPAVPGAPGSVGSAGDAPEACVHPLPHQAADREGCRCAAQFEKMPSGWRPPPAMVRPGMGSGGLAGSASWLACIPTPSQGPPRLCPDSTPLGEGVLRREVWGEERCEGRCSQLRALCAPACQGDTLPYPGRAGSLARGPARGCAHWGSTEPCRRRLWIDGAGRADGAHRCWWGPGQCGHCESPASVHLAAGAMSWAEGTVSPGLGSSPLSEQSRWGLLFHTINREPQAGRRLRSLGFSAEAQTQDGDPSSGAQGAGLWAPGLRMGSPGLWFGVRASA